MPDERPLIDAYMTGRMSYGEVIRVPRKMPADAPFVTVYSESELMHDVLEGIELPPDTDRPRLRYYEVTGMPHLRLADLGTGETEKLAADVGKADDPRCQTLYNEPAELVVSAPAAAYMTDAETGCGLIYDTKIPYTARKLRQLYGSCTAAVRQLRELWAQVCSREANSDYAAVSAPRGRRSSRSCRHAERLRIGVSGA